MKKIIILMAIIGLFSTCSNDDDNSNVKLIEKKITLNNSENYEHSLGYFGDEQGARIVTQAKYFEISKLNRATDEIIYNYKSENDFVGSDFVEIESVNFNISTDNETVINKIRITFNITE